MTIPRQAAHSRANSLVDAGPLSNGTKHTDSASPRQGSPGPGTFAQRFIKSELDGTSDRVGGIEGENDFSGKRYVWIKDASQAFVKGWVVEELSGDRLMVQCDDGSVGLIYLVLGAESNSLDTATRGRSRQRRQGQPGQI